ADHEFVDVDAGVQGLQLGHSHTVLKGQGHKRVAGLDLICSLTVGVGGEGGLNGVEILLHIGGDVLPDNGDVVGKAGGGGVFIGVGGLDGIQNGGEVLPLRGGAHHLSVDQEHVALHHVADAVEKGG